MREASAARTLMTQTKALLWLKEHDMSRYARLDDLYSKNYFDFAEVSRNHIIIYMGRPIFFLTQS